MRMFLRGLGLVVALTFILPLAADDNKKDTDKDSKDKKPAAEKPDAKDKKPDPKEKDKWVPAGDFNAKIVHVEGQKKTIRFQVIVPRGRNVAYSDPIELEAADDIKVRLKDAPVETDLKGLPKKPTAKELKEMKGPGNLWGFTGEFDNLRNEQIVRLFLKKPKNAPRYTGKEKDKDLLPENKPVISMVYIMAEPKK